MIALTAIRRQAHLCVLATNCDEPMYQKLVEALCAEHQIDLIKVDDNKKLGEWAGLCKIDKEGKARKVVGCSCVVVKDYGKETPAMDFLKEYFNSKKSGV
jgi:small subunit ribosomal protein S12e